MFICFAFNLFYMVFQNMTIHWAGKEWVI